MLLIPIDWNFYTTREKDYSLSFTPHYYNVSISIPEIDINKIKKKKKKNEMMCSRRAAFWKKEGKEKKKETSSQPRF